MARFLFRSTAAERSLVFLFEVLRKFLDNFGLVGHADGYWMVIAWFFGLGLGGIVNKLTLGEAGC